jgi:mono/diheme cytochrome c family protein
MLYGKPLLAVTILSLSVACLADPPDSSAPSANASSENGKQLFESIGCSACHGLSGQGGVPSGPKLAPRVIPKVGFLYQLRHPRKEMPPYSSQVLSDQEADAIYAFLLSIPAPRAASSIPLLDGK